MNVRCYRVILNVATCMVFSVAGICPVPVFGSREIQAQQQTPPEQNSPQPSSSIHIAEKAHDFGEVMEGAEITHVFAVKNAGKAPLQITQVRPG